MKSVVMKESDSKRSQIQELIAYGEKLKAYETISVIASLLCEAISQKIRHREPLV